MGFAQNKRNKSWCAGSTQQVEIGRFARADHYFGVGVKNNGRPVTETQILNYILRIIARTGRMNYGSRVNRDIIFSITNKIIYIKRGTLWAYS